MLEIAITALFGTLITFMIATQSPDYRCPKQTCPKQECQDECYTIKDRQELDEELERDRRNSDDKWIKEEWEWNGNANQDQFE